VPAPELPDDIDWHARTVDWWSMWASSELAKDFTATDWSFLLDTALMHHAMWSKGQWTLAAEVRSAGGEVRRDSGGPGAAADRVRGR
jgi:hypothetical protein